ncbi:hypothetical protein JOD96_001680 [Flavobacterium sp. 1355]|nr:hypothetical protein [Flavobacterium sp. 1355]
MAQSQLLKAILMPFMAYINLVTRIYQTNEKNTTINLHLLDKFDI